MEGMLLSRVWLSVGATYETKLVLRILLKTFVHITLYYNPQ